MRQRRIWILISKSITVFTVTRRDQENPGGRYFFSIRVPRIGMLRADHFGVPFEFRATLRIL